MALEAGGYAEKLGNRYEANWVAYQLLQLLDEKILSVTVEPIGDDEVGVDVIIEKQSRRKEFHQCKASHGHDEVWSISKLHQASILKNAMYQIERGVHEFVLVSPLSCKRLTDLSDSSLNSNGNCRDYFDYQIKPSSAREKDFSNLCGYLDLDFSKDNDLAKALLFLQKFKIVQYSINKHTINELEDKVNSLFWGKPRKLLHYLKNYAVELNRLRTKITPALLLNDLKSAGFKPRINPNDERIIPIISRISSDFTLSIEPFLISNSMIKRPEICDIIEALDIHAVTLIRAEAGVGKSSALLELHEHLISNHVISIPIRLDRNRPENNADAFGQKLGFPYSPVLCIRKFARDQKTVIILDQLDAIRWTANHSNNALQVCQEIVRQVLNLREEGVDISIVLACREFELDEDAALSSWINSLNGNVANISLSYLDANTVSRLIGPFENFEMLSSEKQKVLTIPLWLSIYLTIAKREGAPPQFSNKLELVKRFWEDRFNALESIDISGNNALQLIDEIVVLMNNKSRLSVPKNILTISSTTTIEALISVGILIDHSNQISFRHQALFDYQIGKRLFNAALCSQESFLDEIGVPSQQTLTKREHIKYALNMLLEYDQRDFCKAVIAILSDHKIRFHLKYLVFNSLREISDLKSSAKTMVDTIIQDEVLLPKFLSNSCFNHVPFVCYLSECGAISTWLSSEDTAVINNVVRLLKSVSEEIPNIVVNELEVFFDKSNDWNDRIYEGICWNVEDDSDEMFEFRKKLISGGCTVRFIGWRTIANKAPHRALDLIEILLYHYREAFSSKSHTQGRKIDKLTHRDTWSESEIDQLTNIALAMPNEAILRLLKIINEFINVDNNPDSSDSWLYEYRHSSHDAVGCIIKGVFAIIDESGKQLSDQPDILQAVLNPYLSSDNAVIVFLVAKLLVNLPQSRADFVINWLLADPKVRLSCGNTYEEPEWILPGKLIEKFSLYCSEDIYQQLERKIYYYPSIKDVERIKRILEYRRSGLYLAFWGETQYFLLPKLPLPKVSEKSRQLIQVLTRRFKGFSDEDFCSTFNGSGGIVTSPLPIPNTLSNNAWIKLILAPKNKVNKGRWAECRTGMLSESSIEQFSRSLGSAVTNQPTRFANLALSLPADIDQQYINAFYVGLTETDVSRVNEVYCDGWDVCPIELTEQVINHFYNGSCTTSLVRLFDRRIKEKGWSENARHMLVNFAKNAKDPELNMLNVRDIKKSKFANEADVETLRGNAINCDRGIAYRAISRLFWENQETAVELRGLVYSAINDPHPAVNIVALDLLKPFLNYDEDFALSTFIELCNKDLRMTCGYGAHYFFNNGFQGEHQEPFVRIVLKMMMSTIGEVQKEAAKQVVARWFFNDLFQEQIIIVLQGSDMFRKGVSSVISQFLKDGKYQDRFYKIPEIYAHLVNDPNVEILREIGWCVGENSFWDSGIAEELFDVYVDSKAAALSLYCFFNALEKNSEGLLLYKNQLLSLVCNLTSGSDSDGSIRSMDIRESSLINVMQRLYDEATEDENDVAINICLDIWDKLLQSEIYSAVSASKELEKGLLN